MHSKRWCCLVGGGGRLIVVVAVVVVVNSDCSSRHSRNYYNTIFKARLMARAHWRHCVASVHDTLVSEVEEALKRE